MSKDDDDLIIPEDDRGPYYWLPPWKRWLRKRFYTPCEILWPGYECKQCVGQERWQGCYCRYYQAWDVDWPYPPLWAVVGRAIWRWWTGRDKPW